MANRELLHRSKLLEFRDWLRSKGVQLLEPHSEYEVVRWMGRPGRPMPIIFGRRRRGDHLTLNAEAERWVRRWLRERRG